MHVHILGIGGTFMGGIALLAKAHGHYVSGMDANVYPPMSQQLIEAGIEFQEGYTALTTTPDMVIIGNALGRGNPAVEDVLNKGLIYQSGPQWLAEHVLANRWVIAIAGTHGKTTTSSMLAWILEQAGFEPGFLIGGIPNNFGYSARLGKGPFFVIEADEYDTAFFDKRAKFVHYRPKTCILNNLEFDHADIYQNLAEIQKQFHHLVRTIPGNGALIVNQEPNLRQVINQGCWSQLVYVGDENSWHIQALDAAGQQLAVYYQTELIGQIQWSLLGQHNAANALSAVVAAHQVGITPQIAMQALNQFQSPKRRLEIKGIKDEVTIYDDFAHHPTAIMTTIAGLRAKIGPKRLIVALDLRSNTMCLGTHQQTLGPALADANQVMVYQSAKVKWDVEAAMRPYPHIQVHQSIDTLLDSLNDLLSPGDHLVVMSNGGFENLFEHLLPVALC